VTAFIDEALIRVKAGDGGNGAVAFRREKYVPMGGPSGGDGGNGGSVVLEVDEGLGTLLDFRYRSEYRAKGGEHGGNKDMYGRGGDDLVLRVPPGTQVYTKDRDGQSYLLGDLRTHGQRLVVARGGRGGRGNIHFKTSIDRAPRRAYPGSPGQEREIRLELKLLADVGLLGFPNVGKSSFIARVSAARPKIADYPFTTLVPNLGVVGLSGERSFVIADVPGLIKGAHAGAGLGHRFLRHLERTRVLLHLIEAGDGSTPDRSPLKDYEALRRELALFDPQLAERPEIVVLNKLDLPESRKKQARLAQAFARRKVGFHAVSAATGEGMPALLEAIWRVLAQAKPVPAAEAAGDEEAEISAEIHTDVGAEVSTDDSPAGTSRKAEPKKAKSTGKTRDKSSHKMGGKSRGKTGDKPRSKSRSKSGSPSPARSGRKVARASKP
jgi:GTP-binding protein